MALCPFRKRLKNGHALHQQKNQITVCFCLYYDVLLDLCSTQTRTQSLFLCFWDERRLGVSLRRAGSHK